MLTRWTANAKAATVLGSIPASSVSDSYPAFFLLIARLLTKIFKSAETVNVKFDVYEFGDKGQ